MLILLLLGLTIFELDKHFKLDKQLAKFVDIVVEKCNVNHKGMIENRGL